jgi:hypothetical protein
MSSINIISKDITKNTTLFRHKPYLITKEVHVRSGITLSIQDGTLIFILNGVVTNSKLKRAALIFDSGSRMKAKKFTIRAGSLSFKPEKIQNNGGIWFCGNHRSASKDNISIQHSPRKITSKYKALEIKTFYLGRIDSIQKSSKKNIKQQSKKSDDIDGISVLGVGRNEWEVKTLKAYYSGDDGLDLTNSDIQVDSVYIKEPVEDGFNISSSRIQVRKNLSVIMPKNGEDCDLFDLETDDGASYVEINKGCKLNLDGVFGDQLNLSSKDMPPLKKSKKSRYRFKGSNKQADSLIFSITED